MLNRLAHRQRTEGGFILVGLSILLIIVGIAISAYLYTAKVRAANEKAQRTDAAFASVMNKMAHYLSSEGHLPCPAARNLNPTHDNYGVESDCKVPGIPANSCTAGLGLCIVTDATGTKRVRIGIVPFKTLKIDRTDAVDAYGNFLTYAVTEKLASTRENFKPDEESAIKLRTIEDRMVDDVIVPHDVTDTVPLVLISHGQDGAGSFRLDGRPNPTQCSANAADNQNCDFNRGIYNADFLSSRISHGSGANYFDDKIETNILEWVYIWDTTYGDSKGSYSLGSPDSRMGVGTDTPQAMLHVGNNGNLRVEDGRLSTTKICNKDNTHCFNPDVLGGKTEEGKGMKCLNDRLMIDIKEGKPVCGTFSSPRSGGCAPGAFFHSLSYTAGVGLMVTCVDGMTGTALAPRIIN